MAVQNPSRISGPFVGAGAPLVMAFDFETFEADDLHVFVIDNASGALTQLEYPAGFSATLNGDQNASPGGEVTTTAGVSAATTAWVVGLAQELTTDGDLTNAGGFYPAVINRKLDRVHVALLQLDHYAKRAMLAPFGEAGATFPANPGRKGKLLGFDAGTGNPVAFALSGAALETLSSLAAEIVAVAGIEADITAVAGNAVDISAVADIAAQVQATGDASAEIVAVSEVLPDLAIVADNIGAIADTGDLFDALSAGTTGVFLTKKEAQDAMIAGLLTADGYYIVIKDETSRDSRTLYQFKPQATFTNGLVAHGALAFRRVLNASDALLPGFPPGVIGYWRARDYTTLIGGAAVKVIPNLATSVSPQALLSRLPFGAFKYVGAQEKVWFGQPNSAALVATDSVEIDPYGEPNASTLVGTGGDQYCYAWTQEIPSGTNTFAVWLRSRTGVNQNLRLSGNAGVAYQAIVVTPEWQRFTVSWTDAANRASGIRIANDGAAAWNVALYGAKCYPGAAAPGDEPPVGHLYLGNGHAAADAPPVAGGWIDLTAGGFGTADFESAPASRELSISALVKSDGGANQNNYLFVAQRLQAVIGLRDVRATANDTEHNFKGTLDSKGTSKLLLNSRKVQGKGPHVVTFVIRSNMCYTYIDDVQFSAENIGVAPAEVLTKLWRLGGANTALLNNYKVNQIMLARCAWTPGEVRNAYQKLAAAAALDGIGVNPPKNFIIFDGDSLVSFDANNNSWADLYLTNAAADVWAQRRSIGGSTLLTGTIPLSARRQEVLDAIPLPSNMAGRRGIYHVHIGTNDLMTDSEATFLANLQTHVGAIRAKGYKVVANTLLARNAQAVYNARRDSVNATLRTWVGLGYIDALADIAANANIGTEAAAAGAVYFSDGIHLNAAGHAEAYPIIRDAINPLLM